MRSTGVHGNITHADISFKSPRVLLTTTPMCLNTSIKTFTTIFHSSVKYTHTHTDTDACFRYCIGFPNADDNDCFFLKTKKKIPTLFGDRRCFFVATWVSVRSSIDIWKLLVTHTVSFYTPPSSGSVSGVDGASFLAVFVGRTALETTWVRVQLKLLLRRTWNYARGK